jgi:DNA-directed RNA polymerase specialized sigma24 family protein
MDDDTWLAQRFEAERPHLRAVAYRLLGRLDEVDDAVQESWLRLSGSDPSSIANLGAWLMTVVARVCLDMLRARHARREESLEASAPQGVPGGEREIDPDVVFRADQVAVAIGTPKEMRGAPSVARHFLRRAQATQPALVNGSVGVVVAPYGRLLGVLDLLIKGGKITAITAISDPARLRQLHLATLDD